MGLNCSSNANKAEVNVAPETEQEFEEANAPETVAADEAVMNYNPIHAEVDQVVRGIDDGINAVPANTVQKQQFGDGQVMGVDEFNTWNTERQIVYTGPYEAQEVVQQDENVAPEPETQYPQGGVPAQ